MAVVTNLKEPTVEASFTVLRKRSRPNGVIRLTRVTICGLDERLRAGCTGCRQNKSALLQKRP
jgi:hypothetical protein